MIVDKHEFKILQKEGGGITGTDFLCVAKFMSGPIDLPLNSVGNISVKSNGVFFDVLMGKKAFIPMENIGSVNVLGNNIEFEIDQSGNSITLIFNVNKEKDLNKLCDAIIARKGSLSVINASPSVEDDEVRCPKCSSTQLNVQKKGFGVGKAAVGGVLAGPLGLLAGGIGKNKLDLICLKCGHKFKPGAK